jgi:hypothetical protein
MNDNSNIIDCHLSLLDIVISYEHHLCANGFSNCQLSMSNHIVVGTVFSPEPDAKNH